MATPSFPDQVLELKALLRRSHLSEEELATRAHINPDTFRKYLGGYQRCGKQTMENLRLQVQLEEARLENATQRNAPEAALHDDVVVYARKLLELPAAKRDLAKRLIAELGEKKKHEPCEPKPDEPKATGEIADELVAIRDKVLAETPKPQPSPSSSHKQHGGRK